MMWNRPLRLIFCLVISSTLFLLILNILPGTTAEPGSQLSGPQVYIELLEFNKTANVGPGEDGVVTFNGLVQVTKPPGTEVIVTLSADADLVSATVSPVTLPFNDEEEKPFSVSARADSHESAETVATLVVTGTWVLNPGGFPGTAQPPGGVTARVFIAQFYDFSLSSNMLKAETEGSDSVELELTINNEGNGMDTFRIKVLNEYDLDDKDFQVSVSESEVDIYEYQSSSIKIFVTTPDTSGSGKHEVIVQVTSDNGAREGLPPEKLVYEIDHSASLIPDQYIMVIIIIAIIIVCLLFIWRRKKRNNRIKNKKK
ncbi:MAG: hypothetical protein KAJ51_11045 [Thermoplasmata archaeon]|nr:hypothetical protein [Thermoplasmata archaeon]